MFWLPVSKEALFHAPAACTFLDITKTFSQTPKFLPDWCIARPNHWHVEWKVIPVHVLVAYIAHVQHCVHAWFSNCPVQIHTHIIGFTERESINWDMAADRRGGVFRLSESHGGGIRGIKPGEKLWMLVFLFPLDVLCMSIFHTSVISPKLHRLIYKRPYVGDLLQRR